MNEIVKKFLLAGDKFMPEMYLRQPEFAYSACGTFTKIKEQIQKLKETGDSRYIYQNELHKACFQHNMGYGDCKVLTRRTASDKIFRDKAFNILRYFNFEPSFKLRWCRARDLFGSQFQVTTGGFELRISCIRSRYLTH